MPEGRFTVDPGALAAASSTAGKAAENVNAFAGKGQQALQNSSGSCGNDQLQVALLSFQESWVPSLAGLGQVMSTFSQDLMTAANAYQKADVTAATGIDKAPTGGPAR